MRIMRFVPMFLIASVGFACSDGGPFEPEGDAGFYVLPHWPGSLQISAAWGVPQSGSLEFSFRFTVTNTSDRMLVGLSTPDLWRVRVYSDSARTGDPLWEGWSYIPQDIDVTWPVHLEPGGVAEYGARIRPSDLQTVGPGRYYVSAALATFDPAQRTPFSPVGYLVVPQP